jgi:hypothetical protein
MAKGPIYRHAENRPAFERTPCVRKRQLSAVERATHGRPQITARAGSVRRRLTGLRSSSALRATASAFERIPCIRTHFWNLLIISCPFFGMILTCSNIVPIRSLGDAYLNLTKLMSSPFVMIMHVGAISMQTKPLQRFCSVDFIGPPCL